MDMEKVHILDHPLLQHKLSILRDENTGVKDFRQVVSEIATLMCYEATRDLPMEEVEIKTPICTGKFKTIAGKKLAIESASNSPHHLMLKVLKASAFLWTAKKIRHICDVYI